MLNWTRARKHGWTLKDSVELPQLSYYKDIWLGGEPTEPLEPHPFMNNTNMEEEALGS
jgi:hypothetical protein